MNIVVLIFLGAYETVYNKSKQTFPGMVCCNGRILLLSEKRIHHYWHWCISTSLWPCYYRQQYQHFWLVSLVADSPWSRTPFGFQRHLFQPWVCCLGTWWVVWPLLFLLAYQVSARERSILKPTLLLVRVDGRRVDRSLWKLYVLLCCQPSIKCQSLVWFRSLVWWRVKSLVVLL